MQFTYWGSMRPKKNNSILEENCPKNDANAKDDPYEAPKLTYNIKMVQLMEANTISNEVEEENCETCWDGGMMELDDEEKMQCPRQNAQKVS